MMGQVKEQVSANGQVEVVRKNSSKSKRSDLELNISCVTTDEPYNFIESEDEENDENSYLPLPTRKPNRNSSLLEEETVKLPTLKANASVYSAFHPALKAAVLAEGQEAVWVEDEVSTVSSVLVKRTPKPPVEKKPEPTQPSKKFNRFLFRQKPEPIPEVEEVPETEPVKVHVRKVKLKKAVVLLPQHGGGGANTLIEANVTQEAALNMVKARQLLNKALLVGGTPRLQDSERMAKFAFVHAASARRLMATPEEQSGLEEVLSSLAQKGEHAAFQHQKIVFSQSFEDSPRTPKKNSRGKGVISAGNGFAAKAIAILESILPKNVAREITESISEDMWSDEGISTLGFNTDTFEYQMCQAPSQQTKSSTNMELMSISSLNEILDGPMEDDKPSPRKIIPVIHVPTKKVKRKKAEYKTGRRSLPGGIFGFMSPTNAPDKRSHSKVERGYRENTNGSKQEAEMSTDGSMKEKKKRGYIRALRAKQAREKETLTRDEDDSRRAEASDLSERTGTAEAKEGAIPGKIENGLKRKDTTSRKSSVKMAPGTSPSIPSKSLDAELEKQAKDDKYHSIHFKRSEEKRVQVKFDNENSHEDESDKTRSQSRDTDETVHRRQELDKESSGDWSENENVRKTRDHIKSGHRPRVVQKGSTGDWSENESAWDESGERQRVVQSSESDWDESEHPRRIIQDGSTGDWDENVDLRNDEDDKDRRQSRSRNKDKAGDGQQVQAEKSKKETSERKNNGDKNRHYRQAMESPTDRAENESEQRERKIDKSPERAGKDIDERKPGNETRKTEERGDLDRNGCEASLEKAKGDQGGLEDNQARRGDRQARKAASLDHRDRSPTIEPEGEDKTQTTFAVGDSLINFIISPGRANAITHDIARSPSNTLAELVEPSTSFMNEVDEREEDTVEKGDGMGSEKSELEELKSSSEPNPPKIMARIAGIFGSRRGKEKERPEAKQEKKSPEKIPDFEDLEKAVSDGHMKAFEANVNAEDATSRISSRKQHNSKTAKEALPQVIETAISNGNMKAQEANLQSEESPVVLHLKSIRKKATGKSEKVTAKKIEAKKIEVKAKLQSEDPLVSHLKSIRKKSTAKNGNVTIVRGEKEAKDYSEDPLVSHLKSIHKKTSAKSNELETYNLKTKDHITNEHQRGGNADRYRKEKERRRDEERDLPRRSDSERGKYEKVGGPRNRETNGKDAPGGSLVVTTDAPRRDPPKRNEPKYSSLAPTPRRTDEKQDRSKRDDDKPLNQDRYDQRTVTQRLYGGASESRMSLSEREYKRPEKSKDVYIGDLIYPCLVDTPATTASTDQSEDSDESKNNGNGNDHAKTTADPTPASPASKAMVSGQKNVSVA